LILGVFMQKKETAPGVKRDGWDLKEVSEEASNEQPDEIVRKTLRGNTKETAADQRDIAGSADRSDTPQGREETKKSEGEAEQNG